MTLAPSPLPADAGAPAFVVLLGDEQDSRGLANLLQSLALPEASGDARFLVSPVRGCAFFGAADRQDAVDTWWAAHIPRKAHAVLLLAHEDGLHRWLTGLDATVIVAADALHGHLYESPVLCDGTSGDACLAIAHEVVVRFSDPGRAAAGGTSAPPWVVFDRLDARMIANVRRDVPRRAARGARPRPLLDVGGTSAYAPAPSWAAERDPLDLLVAESAQREAVTALWTDPTAAPSPRPRRSRRRLPRIVASPGDDWPVDPDLASRLLARAPMLVVVGSRKGGVGKTSHAAGVAIVAGETLDSVGRRAAIVDANVANPDAWGHLELPADAATVRDVVAALNAGRRPPRPVHAVTAALACYPERRDGVEYTRTEVRRFASLLRNEYAFTVVDMSNRLPDPLAGPEAAVASFWLDEADALILPAATSRQDFTGVLDYLDVPGLPPTVVPWIRASARRTRDHPATRRYLAAIASRVASVVEIPDEADSVRLAGMSGLPVQAVSRRMGRAYRELTAALALLPQRSSRHP